MSLEKWIALKRAWLVAVVLMHADWATAAPGDIDASFGGSGLVHGDMDRDSVFAKDVLAQPDGKIVVVASAANGASVLARFAVDGQLDAAFGEGGIVVKPIDSRSSARAAALQSDGKIIVVGQGSGHDVLLLQRYSAGGALDPTFGDDGLVSLDLDDSVITRFIDEFDVIAQADGRILALAGAGGKFTVVRLLPNGDPDDGFGESGRKDVNLKWDSREPARLALQSGGRILVAGSVAGTIGKNRDGALVRLSEDGSRDFTFGTKGVVRLDRLFSSDVAVQSTDAIVIAGNRNRTQGSFTFRGDLALLRLGPNGGRDRSFGDQGSLVESFEQVLEATALAVQADGRIIVAARSFEQLGALRYLANGKRDKSFDVDGRLSTRIGEIFSNPDALALGPNGTIVLAGELSNGGREDRTRRIAVARYTDKGARDLGFGPRGFQTLGVNLGTDTPAGVVALPDGKVVVAGHTTGANTATDIAALRVDANGAPDPGFGSGGSTRIDTSDSADFPGDRHRESIHTVAVQPDGRILLGGWISDDEEGYDPAFAIVRLTAVGQLDFSFGASGRTIIPRGRSASVRALALQSDGKIVFGGWVCISDETCWVEVRRLAPSGEPDPSFGVGGLMQTNGYLALAVTRQDEILVGSAGELVRLTPEGTPDPDFGIGGSVPLDLEAFEEGMTAIAVRQDGGIVAAGSRGFTLIALDESGDPNPDFGEDGIAQGSFGGEAGTITSLALQSDGKVVVAGISYTRGFPLKEIVARFTAEGLVDGSFGDGGSIVLQDPSIGFDPRVGIGADGSIYVATSVERDGEIDFGLLRLEGDSASLCGNGRIEPAEFCDDGNTDDGDGCSSLCEIEPCFRCSSEPSTCVATPGDDPACEARPTCPVPGDPDFMDVDADGRDGVCDLCPELATPIDDDTDWDGIGNACDLCPVDFDPTGADGGDGVGDVCDPCLGGPPLTNARLIIRSLHSGLGDKRVKLRGTLDLPPGTPLEPHLGSIEVVVADASDSVLGVWTLEGAHDPLTGGWLSAGGSNWQFASGTGRSPIISASLKPDAADAERIHFTIVVSRGEIGAPPLRFPLRATVRYQRGTFHQCSKAVFDEDVTPLCTENPTQPLICG